MAKRILETDGTVKEGEHTIIEYPSNSNKSKTNKDGIKPVITNKKITDISSSIDEDDNKKVIKKGVIRKKSSFFSSFIKDNFQDAFGYVVNDVLVPALKNTVSDVIKNGTDIMIYGETRKNRRPGYDGGYTTYSYTSIDNQYNKPRTVRNSRLSLDDLILESKGDAEEVVDRLINRIDKYGSASVADLYDAIGERSEYTDNDYGWYDLSNARLRQVRGGWLLELPRPVCLK